MDPLLRRNSKTISWHHPQLVRRTRLLSGVPIPELVLDCPQAQECGERSSDLFSVLLFTLDFIYGLDSQKPYTFANSPII